ncbi:MAG: hypothetical protein CMH83_18750 [Nocardioides sp.]|nr:hypothetical protein [Nocardioides sp.]
MKKLIVGLFAALLTMAGLAAVPSPQASAACPYTGCVDTTTVLNGPTQGFRGDRLRFAVGVTAGDSIGTPRGSVRFKFVKADGPKRGTKFFFNKRLKNGVASKTINANFLINKGKGSGIWRVKVVYLKVKDSKWTRSTAKSTVKVYNRKG